VKQHRYWFAEGLLTAHAITSMSRRKAKKALVHARRSGWILDVARDAMVPVKPGTIQWSIGPGYRTFHAVERVNMPDDNLDGS